MSALNPLSYKPAQIAKALIAALTSVIALAGLAAATFSDGALATVGVWATAVAVFLTPFLVFLQKAAPWIEMLQGSVPGLPGSERE